MIASRLFVNGSELQIDSCIGKGGEGAVFSIKGMPHVALKAYHSGIVKTRENKIRAMIKSGAAAKAPTVAFPSHIVINERGEFAGFLMPRVTKHKEIHELQTPSSRQMHFPAVDYAFIVRVALNIASVFAKIHETGFVIGDINERGILVSDNATVTVIDADSFQIIDGAERYLCEVGVPEYTPPELQGKHLKSMLRTRDHDAFGLAVILFRLLCMDRHPFSGRFSGVGDMPIEKAIAEFRFAYSSLPNNMEPPPDTVRLSDFPTNISNRFEEAFSRSQVGFRPSAATWVKALRELESSLRICSRVKAHKYSRNAPECPWCRMESAYGRPLFIDANVSFVPNQGAGIDPSKGYVPNLSSFLSAINSVSIPNSVTITLPKFSSMPSPRYEAIRLKSEKSMGPLWKVFGSLVILAGFICALASGVFVFGILGLGLGIWLFSRPSGSPSGLLAEFRNCSTALKSRIEALQRSSPINDLLRKKAEALDALAEFDSLSISFSQVQTDFERNRREKQLASYLSGKSIRWADIPKLSTTDVAQLASYGISTAFDARGGNLQRVHGIGPVKATNIMKWVAKVQTNFQYRNEQSAEERITIQRAKADIIEKQRGLEDRLIKMISELNAARAVFEHWAARIDPEVNSLCQQLAQIESDLIHLGVNPPARPQVDPFRVPDVSGFRRNPNSVTSAKASSATSSPASYSGKSLTVTCPNCNSPMVTRKALRGSRSGSVFWGCSRYPNCQGTRSI